MDEKFTRRFESFKNSLDSLAELITGDVWMDMLKIRNQLAHDYDGIIVKEHCQNIIHVYIDKLYEFRAVVEDLLM